MIVFSLKDPVSCEKICSKINKMIQEEIKNKEQAEKSYLVITLKEVVLEVSDEQLKIS